MVARADARGWPVERLARSLERGFASPGLVPRPVYGLPVCNGHDDHGLRGCWYPSVARFRSNAIGDGAGSRLGLSRARWRDDSLALRLRSLQDTSSYNPA